MTEHLPSKVDGSMRDLTRLALSETWSIAAGVDLLGSLSPREVLDEYWAGLRPLADVEPAFDGPSSKGLRDWLKPIGIKIAPSMAPDVCAAWLTAVVMALSDFPARVAIKAAREAIRVPMQFLNEADGHVRAHAEKLMERHRLALFRLQQMTREIERAAQPPQPQLTAPVEDEPISDAEVRALSPQFRRIGLAQGWITQEQVDAALASAPAA